MGNPDIYKAYTNATITIGKRKGISAPDMRQFVDMQMPKVAAFFEHHKIELSEKAINDNFPNIMKWLSLSDEEIDQRMAQESGKFGKRSKSGFYEKAFERDLLKDVRLKNGFYALVLLFTAWKLGKQVLTLAFIFLISYFFFLHLKKEEGKPVTEDDR